MLGWSNGFGGRTKRGRGAGLHFADDNEPISPQDEVDFASGSAPVLGDDEVAVVFVPASGQVFTERSKGLIRTGDHEGLQLVDFGKFFHVDVFERHYPHGGYEACLAIHIPHPGIGEDHFDHGARTV